MKPIGNIAGQLDLSKPVTQAQVEKALAKANKPLTVRQVAKAGYGLELLAATPIAELCAVQAGRRIAKLPRFVKV